MFCKSGKYLVKMRVLNNMKNLNKTNRVFNKAFF